MSRMQQITFNVQKLTDSRMYGMNGRRNVVNTKHISPY